MTAFSDKAQAGGVEPPVTATPDDDAQIIRVWDPVVRLFHWSLVAGFVIAWATGDELQRLHEITGYTIVGLLAVRVIWGFVGTTHALLGFRLPPIDGNQPYYRHRSPACKTLHRP